MGRSYCPHCHHLIRGYDNIPLFSWLILRGKCRDCKGPISPRYFIIETANTLAWIGIFAHFWGTPQSGLIPLFLVYASAGIALFMIDLDTMTLPNVITYPLVLFIAGYLLIYGIINGDWSNLETAAIVAVGEFALLYGIWWITDGHALGFGDVKMSLGLGLITGWFGIGAGILGFFGAFVIGAIPGTFLLLTKKVGKKHQVPFGPMLLSASWIGILWGPQISNAYLSLIHVS